MQYIARKLDVAGVLGKKSCFLFGPRQCGKTFLVRKTLPDAYVFDLLSGETFRRLARNPGYIEEARIETKTTRHAAKDDLKGLRAIADEGTFNRRILVCDEPRPLVADGIEIMPWRQFIDELWSERLF